MPLFPAIDGTAAIRAPARAFVSAFVRRVEAGLLSGTSGRRCRYVVTETASDALQFRAMDWPTAANVGLNDVRMTVSASGVVQYDVRYTRWAAFALALSGGFGLVFIAFLLTFDLRGYIAGHPGPEYLGLSPDQNVAIAWGMALFWGFGWPWILIPLHKRPPIDGAAHRRGRRCRCRVTRSSARIMRLMATVL